MGDLLRGSGFWPEALKEAGLLLPNPRKLAKVPGGC